MKNVVSLEINKYTKDYMIRLNNSDKYNFLQLNKEQFEQLKAEIKRLEKE